MPSRFRHSLLRSLTPVLSAAKSRITLGALLIPRRFRCTPPRRPAAQKDRLMMPNCCRHFRRHRFVVPALAAALSLLLPAAAFAIQPAEWTHTSEADFEAGEIDGTVVTSLGDIKLAIGTETLQELPEEGSIIYDLEPIDGQGVYIAAGPEAKLMKKTPDDEIETLAELPNEQAFALTTTADGRLLVALSGSPSRLAVLEDGELVTLVELPEVRYIWDVLAIGDALVLATGTEGRVLRVQPDAFDAEAEENPGLEVLLDTHQANVLSLAYDAPRERLYAGTDTEGLVYRITFDGDGQPEPFVMYDAPEPEIGALAVSEDGTLYAGTADAEQARPGRMDEAQSEPAGRPGQQPEPAQPEADEPEPADPGDLPQVPPEAEPMEPGAPTEPNGEAETPDAEAPTEDDPATPDEGDDAEAPELPGTPEPEPQQRGGPNGEQNGDQSDAADEPDGEPTAATDEVTPEQRDQLRAVIRQRLNQAREGGELQVSPGMTQQRRTRATAPSRTGPPQRQQPSQEGNAIYRIDEQGFVTEDFRESVMILRLIETDGRLLVATGNEGQLYSINAPAEETSTVVDLEPQQISALLRTSDGGILLGTANPAKLMRLDRRFASRGTFTSPVMDAAQISLWGKLRVTAEVPENTSLTVETRSGNVRDPENGPWSPWSDAQSIMPDADRSPLHPRGMDMDSPPARFVQYRLTLTGDRQTTPAVNQVQLAYVTPNMAPSISSIQAQYPEPRSNRNGDAAPSTTMNIQWEASDPNDDALVHKLEYRPAGSERFLPITDRIEGTSHEWQTRRVPDGRYVIRITTSDRRDNPGDMAKTSRRLTDPVLVDNTAPRLENLDQQPVDEAVELTGEAVDALSPIASISYIVNDAEEYTPVLPADLIFDSTREQWSVTLADLAPGQHVVTLRVRDQRGNTTHQAMIIEIE